MLGHKSEEGGTDAISQVRRLTSPIPVDSRMGKPSAGMRRYPRLNYIDRGGQAGEVNISVPEEKKIKRDSIIVAERKGSAKLRQM